MKSVDLEVDLAVIGGGACGLVTALRAVEAGVQSVAIFEKSVRQGCNAQFSSGSLAAGGTRFQRDAGVDDSPQRHARDLMAVSGDRSDEEIVLALCRAAPRYVEWLADDLDYPLELGIDMPRAGQSVPRLHTDVGRVGGSRLIDTLRRAVGLSSRIALVDSTPGTGLIEGDDGVIGATVLEPTGEKRVLAGAVVLAADGFGANQQMLSRYAPDAVGRVYGGVSTSTGDAIEWGVRAGAATKNMGAFLGHGLMVRETGTRLNPSLPLLGAVLVNPDGDRFVVESAQGYSKLGNILMRQPTQRSLLVWDEEAMEAASNSELMRDSSEARAWRRYEDLEELARATGIAVSKLVDAISGTVATPGIGPSLRPLALPLYAAWVTGGILTTQGGLRVDTSGRVLRPDGTHLRRLYAGGGSAAGISGPSADGYSSGNGLLTAFGFGWIIGEHAASVL